MQFISGFPDRDCSVIKLLKKSILIKFGKIVPLQVKGHLLGRPVHEIEAEPEAITGLAVEKGRIGIAIVYRTKVVVQISFKQVSGLVFTLGIVHEKQLHIQYTYLLDIVRQDDGFLRIKRLTEDQKY
jgi:hypothetical protein